MPPEGEALILLFVVRDEVNKNELLNLLFERL